MKHKNTLGHIAAFITILIWGTTFISTKLLLNEFTPIEILFYRFVIGFVVLLMIYPYRLKVTSKKHEFIFASAGLCGVTLYYLLENIALTFTMASNVGVISSVVPFFTAIVTYLFLKEEPLRINFFIGFIVAVIGIYLISFNGISKFQLNPFGDLLAVIATLVWATYSVLTRKISSYGYHTIQVTRRVFFYGILFMMPTLLLFDFEWELKRFTNPVSLFNILFLGLCASALCFITWNYSVKILGTITSSIYIYAVPVITVLTSIIVLHEQITYMSAFGIVLTLSGLFISEKKLSSKKAEKNTSLIKLN